MVLVWCVWSFENGQGPHFEAPRPVDRNSLWLRRSGAGLKRSEGLIAMFACPDADRIGNVGNEDLSITDFSRLRRL